MTSERRSHFVRARPVYRRGWKVRGFYAVADWAIADVIAIAKGEFVSNSRLSCLRSNAWLHGWHLRLIVDPDDARAPSNVVHLRVTNSANPIGAAVWA
ncbi:hypothetical protein [Sphingosinicella rhizophila]|uniref:Uncharacterized protein n=1 Tax=Sphingosinicella rhizophila TaxID=3050082 RepID=A0ABU3Q534_9SPHN|nr:hypothetical protein [Sphingosinicella sp. GR2756]MDT9598521.1 hypothetical protein [Sphingosinicella sp. GR2756]